MRNYRDLEVWKLSHKLTLELYAATKKFPKDEMFGLASQLRRAAVSVGANLAEGCGRRTSPEFARFIRIAMGSASDLITICCFAGISGLSRLNFMSGTRKS